LERFNLKKVNFISGKIMMIFFDLDGKEKVIDKN